ncbi:MAG: hypothetical protein U7123_01865 [Potamolinea sp.]
MISKIIASTILFLALAPQGKQIAQEAPLSRFLLKQPCVNTGLSNWDVRREDVSVGRAFYTSRLYMGAGDRYAALTCRLQPNKGGVIFQRLRLSYGMRDNDVGSPGATVHVYVDGRKVSALSRSILPGQKESLALDVGNAKNVSLEVVCSNQLRYCDRVYFWEAELEYPRLPKQ